MLTWPHWKDTPPPAAIVALMIAGITGAKVSRTKLFCRHQSVGMNMLDGNGPRNGAGARVAATAWLTAIAQASPK